MIRNCCEIINQMLAEIPATETDFIEDLNWNYKDAWYKAPEETIQWQRTMETLMKHIPKPEFDWQWKVLSIFTTKPIDEIKKSFEKENENDKN
jgi:hypothetical protein